MRDSTTAALHPDRLISGPVAWWHVQLGAIALLNLVLWTVSAAAVARGPSASNAACIVQLVLSAVYVLGCAFRSVLPVYDIPRIVIVESRLSSVMVGRSVATVAELCFAAQWALILHRIAALSHSPFGHAVSLMIIPLVVIAEICSWHSVLTTQQRGHMFENSLVGRGGRAGGRKPAGDWFPPACGLLLADGDLVSWRRRLRRVHIPARCAHVLVAMACGPRRRTSLSEYRPRRRRCVQAAGGVPPMAGLEERDAVDVSLFQLGGVEQYFAGVCVHSIGRLQPLLSPSVRRHVLGTGAPARNRGRIVGCILGLQRPGPRRKFLGT
jgi:hypothetical protein